MKKILFLDIDGVLNTKWWYTQMDRNTPRDKYGYAFDPRAVANLKKIVEETGADIVMSSSWKSMGLSQMKEMWSVRNLPGNIIDITPDYLSESLLNSDLNNDEVLYERGCEIKGWLSLHKDEAIHYAILDDMDDILPEQQQRFVQTDPELGITEADAKTIICILNH